MCLTKKILLVGENWVIIERRNFPILLLKTKIRTRVFWSIAPNMGFNGQNYWPGLCRMTWNNNLRKKILTWVRQNSASKTTAQRIRWIQNFTTGCYWPFWDSPYLGYMLTQQVVLSRDDWAYCHIWFCEKTFFLVKAKAKVQVQPGFQAQPGFEHGPILCG